MKTAFQKMYQQYYSDYEPYDAFLFHAQEELKDCFLEGKDILEIGCGRGAFSLFMALSGKAQKVLALDESAGFGADGTNLRRLEEIVRNHSIDNVETIEASISKIPFPEGSFDVIVANFSLHHVIRSSWCLPENQKAQKPNQYAADNEPQNVDRAIEAHQILGQRAPCHQLRVECPVVVDCRDQQHEEGAAKRASGLLAPQRFCPHRLIR